MVSGSCLEWEHELNGIPSWLLISLKEHHSAFPTLSCQSIKPAKSIGYTAKGERILILPLIDPSLTGFS